MTPAAEEATMTETAETTAPATEWTVEVRFRDVGPPEHPADGGWTDWKPIRQAVRFPSRADATKWMQRPWRKLHRLTGVLEMRVAAVGDEPDAPWYVVEARFRAPGESLPGPGPDAWSEWNRTPVPAFETIDAAEAWLLDEGRWSAKHSWTRHALQVDQRVVTHGPDREVREVSRPLPEPELPKPCPGCGKRHRRPPGWFYGAFLLLFMGAFVVLARPTVAQTVGVLLTIGSVVLVARAVTAAIRRGGRWEYLALVLLTLTSAPMMAWSAIDALTHGYTVWGVAWAALSGLGAYFTFTAWRDIRARRRRRSAS